MATVPGDPNQRDNVTPMLPKQFQPTMADFLQAAAIMDQKGRFQVAGDVIPFPPSASTPLGRRQIRGELSAGQQKYEATLPPATKRIDIEDIKSRVKDD